MYSLYSSFDKCAHFKENYLTNIFAKKEKKKKGKEERKSNK